VLGHLWDAEELLKERLVSFAPGFEPDRRPDPITPFRHGFEGTGVGISGASGERSRAADSGYASSMTPYRPFWTRIPIELLLIVVVLTLVACPNGGGGGSGGGY
jgi:hypothetical protein